MEISIGHRFSPALHVRERTMECTYIVRVCVCVCVCSVLQLVLTCLYMAL